MAITKTPLAADAPEPYTVTRAFFWAGGVVTAGTVLQLSKTDAIPLLAATKLVPGEPAAEQAEADRAAAEQAEKTAKKAK